MISSELAAWVLLAATIPGAESARIEQSLNGTWEHRIVEDLSDPMAEEGFTPCDVPGYLRGHDYQRAWLRRTFTVPAEIQGKRIKIRFGGVKYNSRVYVNGKHVGGSFGGYQPFEVASTGPTSCGSAAMTGPAYLPLARSTSARRRSGTAYATSRATRSSRRSGGFTACTGSGTT